MDLACGFGLNAPWQSHENAVGEIIVLDSAKAAAADDDTLKTQDHVTPVAKTTTFNSSVLAQGASKDYTMMYIYLEIAAVSFLFLVVCILCCCSKRNRDQRRRQRRQQSAAETKTQMQGVEVLPTQNTQTNQLSRPPKTADQKASTGEPHQPPAVQKQLMTPRRSHHTMKVQQMTLTDDVQTQQKPAKQPSTSNQRVAQTEDVKEKVPSIKEQVPVEEPLPVPSVDHHSEVMTIRTLQRGSKVYRIKPTPSVDISNQLMDAVPDLDMSDVSEATTDTRSFKRSSFTSMSTSTSYSSSGSVTTATDDETSASEYTTGSTSYTSGSYTTDATRSVSRTRSGRRVVDSSTSGSDDDDDTSMTTATGTTASSTSVSTLRTPPSRRSDVSHSLAISQRTSEGDTSASASSTSLSSSPAQAHRGRLSMEVSPAQHNDVTTPATSRTSSSYHKPGDGQLVQHSRSSTPKLEARTAEKVPSNTTLSTEYYAEQVLNFTHQVEMSQVEREQIFHQFSIDQMAFEQQSVTTMSLTNKSSDQTLNEDTVNTALTSPQFESTSSVIERYRQRAKYAIQADTTETSSAPSEQTATSQRLATGTTTPTEQSVPLDPNVIFVIGGNPGVATDIMTSLQDRYGLQAQNMLLPHDSHPHASSGSSEEATTTVFSQLSDTTNSRFSKIKATTDTTRGHSMDRAARSNTPLSLTSYQRDTDASSTTASTTLSHSQTSGSESDSSTSSAATSGSYVSTSSATSDDNTHSESTAAAVAPKTRGRAAVVPRHSRRTTALPTTSRHEAAAVPMANRLAADAMSGDDETSGPTLPEPKHHKRQASASVSPAEPMHSTEDESVHDHKLTVRGRRKSYSEMEVAALLQQLRADLRQENAHSKSN